MTAPVMRRAACVAALVLVTVPAGSGAATRTIAKGGLLGDVRMDADARGAATIGWRQLRGDDWVVKVADLRGSRFAGAPVTLRRSAAGMEVSDLDVTPGGMAVACLRLRRSDDSQAWGVSVARRPPGGRWGRLVTVRRAERYLDDVSCGVDESGAVTVAWTEDIGGPTRVVTVDPGGRVQAPILLGRDTEPAQVEVAPGGDASVLFAEGGVERRRIMVAERPAGGAWGRPLRLSPAGQITQGPELAVGGTGARTAMWNTDAGIAVSAGPGAPTVTKLTEAPEVALAVLAAGPRGDVLAGWETNAYGESRGVGRLQVTVQRPGTAFGSPVTLGVFSAYPLGAALAADGTAGVVWVAGTERRPKLVARGLGPAGWGRTHALDGVGVGLDVGVITAPGGRSTVAWSRESPRGPTSLRVATLGPG